MVTRPLAKTQPKGRSFANRRAPAGGLKRFCQKRFGTKANAAELACRVLQLTENRTDK